MKTDKDFKFNVLVSDEGYTDKQQITAAIEGGSIGRQLRKKLGLKSKLNFRPITTNPEELLELVLEGHTFCGLFNPPSNTKTQTYINADGCYTMSAKKSEFFCGSYFIGIDVDETSYTSIADYIQKLTFKPTFYYTSMSHL